MKSKSEECESPKVNRMPETMDIHVGKRLRAIRKSKGWTQAQLGRFCGVSFQQIQKYETGFNRMGASRLYQLAKFFNVPVVYFFEESETTNTGLKTEKKAISINKLPQDPSVHRESKNLLKAFYQIEDLKLRDKMLQVIKSLGNSY